MDEHKKLNKSKFYNKSKHKNPKYAQKKRLAETVTAKPAELSKNWDRYEEEEHSEEIQCESSKDYSVISNRPISQGTSFHFKKDKYFLPDEAEQQKQSIDDIFKIDLNLLCLGLETIPFCERFNIDEKYFKENELTSMKSKADEAIIFYDMAVKEKLEHSTGVNNLNKSLIEMLIPEGKKEDANDSLSTSVESLNEEEDFVEVNKDAAVQDLEDWLDDILK